MASLPLLPFTLPARLVTQALDDLHAIAEAARRLPEIEARLTEQFETLNAQAQQIAEMGERFLERTAAFDRQAERLVEQGERLHERGGDILEQSERLYDRSEEMLTQTERVIASAQEVAIRGAEVAAALPHLQQLATTAEPLQGTIERFGRFVDRLPGAARRPEGEDL